MGPQLGMGRSPDRRRGGDASAAGVVLAGIRLIKFNNASSGSASLGVNKWRGIR